MTNFCLHEGHSSFLPAIEGSAAKCWLQCGHSNLNSFGAAGLGPWRSINHAGGLGS
jgi:hypothetical protein